MFDKLEAFAQTHPTLMSSPVLWALVSAFITALFRSRTHEELAALPRPIGFILGVCSRAGLDSRELVALLRGRIGIVKITTDNRPKIDHDDDNSIPPAPPPPPMVMALLLAWCAWQTEACVDGPTPLQHADVAAYQAEQLDCVNRYSTRETIDACRDAIRYRHGRMRDAGHE